MKQAILSFGTALILSTVFTALLIPFLKRKHIGQNIREVGPKHQKKAGRCVPGTNLTLLSSCMKSTELTFYKSYVITVYIFCLEFVRLPILRESDRYAILL